MSKFTFHPNSSHDLLQVVIFQRLRTNKINSDHSLIASQILSQFDRFFLWDTALSHVCFLVAPTSSGHLFSCPASTILVKYSGMQGNLYSISTTRDRLNFSDVFTRIIIGKTDVKKQIFPIN